VRLHNYYTGVSAEIIFQKRVNKNHRRGGGKFVSRPFMLKVSPEGNTAGETIFNN